MSFENERYVSNRVDRIQKMEEQVTISQLYIEKLEQENARLRDLLREVVNDDQSRYNRPSYYFKIKKALEKSE